MSERRVFTESEISEILIRAAKLQEEAPAENATYAPGFTRDELLRMATELGLDHEFIEQAIRQQGASSVTETRGRTFLGVPFGTEVEHILDGEVPTDRYDLLAETIGGRALSRGQGIRQLGRSLTGPYVAGAAAGTFTVTPRDGRTRVRFRFSPYVAYFCTMHWIGLICLMLFPILIGNGKLPVAQGVISMLVGLGLGWMAFGALARDGLNTMKKKAADVADKLQEEVDALRENLGKPTVAESSTEQVAKTQDQST